MKFTVPCSTVYKRFIDTVLYTYEGYKYIAFYSSLPVVPLLFLSIVVSFQWISNVSHVLVLLLEIPHLRCTVGGREWNGMAAVAAVAGGEVGEREEMRET